MEDPALMGIRLNIVRANWDGSKTYYCGNGPRATVWV